MNLSIDTSDTSKVNSSPVFSLRDVCFGFGTEVLFSLLSFEIYQNEFIAFLGPSGTGKSTLLKILSGLLRPSRGRVLFQGMDLNVLAFSQQALFRRRVGMTFQHGGLFDSMTVGENLRFPLRELTQSTLKQIDQRVGKALSDVGLEGRENLLIHEMSGGMQKRLGIARALLLSPEVILYDDPTAGLDPVTSRSIMRLIADVKEKYGMTVIMVASDPFQIFDLADRIGFLYEGSLLEVGPPEQVRNSKNRVVEQFMKGLIHGPLT